MPEQPLRVFVAMPGTDMGSNASLKEPAAVKENLLDLVAERLERTLGRKVELVIEKEKRAAGHIHESMFAEARDAEVYIADLTGANPNVYLELGVRWALRDYVTVLICQSVEDLRFNVAASRAIMYRPDNMLKAANDVVNAIIGGLGGGRSDSIVRANSDYVQVSRSELEGLRARIGQLEQERGEDLIRVARNTGNSARRIELLRAALDVSPGSVDALIELGIALREMADYAGAVEYLEEAVRLAGDNAAAHRELGVACSKAGEFVRAAAELRRAVGLDREDAEAWSNLGGALRRAGMADAERGRYDTRALLESRDSYAEAHKLREYNLYSALNVARLDILLSKWEPERFAQGIDEFAIEVDLCRHEVRKEPGNFWRRFDLADALLFSEAAIADARMAYDEAIDLTPNDHREDVFGTVLGPLRDLITAQILQDDLLAEVEHVTAAMEDAIRDTRRGA